MNRGEISAAANNLLKGLDFFENTFGDDHPETARYLYGLGNTCFRNGEIRQAFIYLKRAFAILERYPEYPGASRAECLSALTTLYFHDDNQSKILTLQDGQEIARFIDNFSGFEFMNHGGISYVGKFWFRLGELEKAVKFYKLALAQGFSQGSPHHAGNDPGFLPYTLIDLASTLSSLHRYAEALPYFKEAIRTGVELLGKNSPVLKRWRVDYRDALNLAYQAPTLTTERVIELP